MSKQFYCINKRQIASRQGYVWGDVVKTIAHGDATTLLTVSTVSGYYFLKVVEQQNKKIEKIISKISEAIDEEGMNRESHLRILFQAVHLSFMDSSVE